MRRARHPPVGGPFRRPPGLIVALESVADHVRVRILKSHDHPEAPDINMELDPRTLLLRWR